MNTFLWLVKREFWEHRGSFLWVPVITAGIMLLLNLIGIITAEVFASRHGIDINGMNFERLSRHMDANALVEAGRSLEMIIYSVAGIIGIVLFFVVFFYSLGSLYDDRRDRSVFFWKSLPISDHATVLSKFVSAAIVAPIIAMVVGVLAGLISVLMMLTAASMHGLNLWGLLFTSAHPLTAAFSMLSAVPVFAVWALPMIGWLMLCSAWARSKPFLWAIALPVGVGALLSWLDMTRLIPVDSGWYWRHVASRLLLGTDFGTLFDNHISLDGSQSIGMANIAWIWSTLGEPAAWIGAAAGVGMLAAAIWLRRWRTEL